MTGLQEVLHPKQTIQQREKDKNPLTILAMQSNGSANHS